MISREERLNAAFVALADTLVSDFDVNGLLYQLASACVDLLDCDQAGILIADASQHLRVVGSSSEALRLLELFELQSNEGPCLDAYRSGVVVREPDLTAAGGWPRFRTRAVSEGFRAVDAMPMRLRGSVLGAVNVLHRRTGGLNAADLATAQALADVATIALVQERSLANMTDVAINLRRALAGQVAVEQAKGMLAERAGVSIGEAFELLRSYARRNNRRLVDVAGELLAGELAVRTLQSE